MVHDFIDCAISFALNIVMVVNQIRKMNKHMCLFEQISFLIAKSGIFIYKKTELSEIIFTACHYLLMLFQSRKIV